MSYQQATRTSSLSSARTSTEQMLSRALHELLSIQPLHCLTVLPASHSNYSGKQCMASCKQCTTQYNADAQHYAPCTAALCYQQGTRNPTVSSALPSKAQMLSSARRALLNIQTMNFLPVLQASHSNYSCKQCMAS